MGEGARTRSDYNPSYVTRNGDILNCKFLGRGPRPRRGLPCENLKWKRTANPRECAVCLSKGNASRTDDARDDDDEGRNGEQKKKNYESRVGNRLPFSLPLAVASSSKPAKSSSSLSHSNARCLRFSLWPAIPPATPRLWSLVSCGWCGCSSCCCCWAIPAPILCQSSPAAADRTNTTRRH